MATLARRIGGLCAIVVPAAFIVAFFGYPVVTILWRGLGHDGVDALGDVWGSSRQRGIIWFTVWQAAVSTVLTLAVALPGAAMVARFGGRTRRLFRALVTVPFVLPTIVVAGAYECVFDRFGLDE